MGESEKGRERRQAEVTHGLSDEKKELPAATNEHESCEPANNGEWEGGRDKEK
jgi:hypothetical protein